MFNLLKSFALFILVFSQLSVVAQSKAVLLDPAKRNINQGNALPSQASFDIQVPVTEKTGIIKIKVFKGSTATSVVDEAAWTRPQRFNESLAELPVNVRLKTNNTYGFDVMIYDLLDDSERTSLQAIVHRNLTNYLDATIEANSKGLDLDKNAARVVQDLNAVVRRSLTYYTNTQQREFEGFSDVVKLKLQQVSRARLSNARYNIQPDAADSLISADEIKAQYANQLMEELEAVILSEADNYLNLDFVQLADKFAINNRPTERAQTVLPLFIGYGGVYLGGSFNNLQSDNQAYAGLSFPLGRGNESHFGRTSFILGLFLNNLKDGQGNTITGPVIDRPILAGLGFRIYDFIHLNAGAVATSASRQSLTDIKTQDIKIQPFIGLNATLNLWLGLNKKH
jgi:transposase-like protein